MGDANMQGTPSILDRLRNSQRSASNSTAPLSEQAVNAAADNKDDLDATNPIEDKVMDEIEESRAAEEDVEEEYASGELPFTLYDMSDSTFEETQCGPETPIVNFVGDYSVLADYISKIEDRVHLTLPPYAYGVDIAMFEGLDSIELNGKRYELVCDGGCFYLSCCSEILDKDYLEEIIRQATCAIMSAGIYRFVLVGPRMFTDEDGLMKIIKTMRLNTYELNYLIAYMRQFTGVTVNDVKDENGSTTLVFEK